MNLLSREKMFKITLGAIKRLRLRIEKKTQSIPNTGNEEENQMQLHFQQIKKL